MNRIHLALIFLLCVTFSSCEKDDICVEGDTPLLIVRFYDAENPTEFKAVPLLRVAGIGNSFTVSTISDRTSTLDSIAIPLKENETLTEFAFITNSEDDENGAEIGDIDILSFSYELKEEFISRACGFIVNYENLNSDFTTTTDNWIQSIEVVKDTVQLETEDTTAHVKIFH
ncbi:MAG: DUF6452 family protein [Maribacter sp.]